MKERVVVEFGIRRQTGKHAFNYVKPSDQLRKLSNFSVESSKTFTAKLEQGIWQSIQDNPRFKKELKNAESFLDFEHMMHFPKMKCSWCNIDQACDPEAPCDKKNPYSERCSIHSIPHSPCDTFPTYLKMVHSGNQNELVEAVSSTHHIHGGWDAVICGGYDPAGMYHLGWFTEFQNFSCGGLVLKDGDPPELTTRLHLPMMFRFGKQEVEAIVYIFARGFYTVGLYRENNWKLPKKFWRKLGVELRIYDIDDNGIRVDETGARGLDASAKVVQQYQARYQICE